jgi:hypothetical protein
MLIRIWIASTQPLAGTASAKGSDPVHFDGWLELLGAISDLVGADAATHGNEAGRTSAED